MPQVNQIHLTFLNTGTDNSSGSSFELNAKVQIGTDGVHVTNQEGSEWTACMVGLNGGDGWGFDNPPFKTHVPLTIRAEQEIIVPYTKITKDDGTQFDITTQTVNSSVVECFQGTEDERSWTGTSSS